MSGAIKQSKNNSRNVRHKPAPLHIQARRSILTDEQKTRFGADMFLARKLTSALAQPNR
jgi:hypothetical protein